MKRLFFLLLLSLLGTVASAQDLIVLKDATEILSKITLITPTSVKYHDWDSRSGPTRTLDKDKILLIKFANGKTVQFTGAKTQSLFSDSSTSLPVSYEETPDVYTPIDSTRRTKITFQGYIGAGLGTNSKQSLIGIDGSVGARVFDYFYAGADLGYGMYKYKKADKSTFKLYFEYGVNLRGYVPAGNNIYPFLSLSFGGVVPESSEVNSKAFCRLSAGLDYEDFSAGIGWNKVCDSNYFIVQFAWRFGK